MEKEFYKLDDRDVELIKEVERVTLTNYEIKNNFIRVENLIGALENLLNEYIEKDKNLCDFKQEVDEFYKLKNNDPYEELGINERDFY